MTAPRSRARAGGRAPKRIVWTAQALADLEAIGDYIARDDERAATRWVAKLIAAAERAALVPMAGRRVPELERDDVREVLVRTYRVVYWLHDAHLEILTVFEGHRLLPPIAPR